MPNTHSTLTSLFQDIADSIRQKTGASSDQKIVADNFPTEIANIPTGGSPTPTVDEENDVMFYDYDGTVLYTYTAEEFAQLTEMPPNPTHSGLTAQGWNWSFSDAKAFVATRGVIDIGQMYIPSDRKTHIHIKFDRCNRIDSSSLTPICQIGLNMTISSGGDITIEWGDNSSDNYTGTDSAKVCRHTYNDIGEYEIKIAVNSGTVTIAGSPNWFNDSSDGAMIPRKIFIGSNISYTPGSGSSPFTGMRHLDTLVLPYDSLPEFIQSNIISSVNNLRHLTIPSGSVTSKYRFASSNYYLINSCDCLRSISYPANFDIIYTYNVTSIVTLVGSTDSTSLRRLIYTGSMSHSSGVPKVTISSPCIRTCVLPTGIANFRITTAVPNLQKIVLYGCNLTELDSSVNYPSLYSLKEGFLVNVSTFGSGFFGNAYSLKRFEFSPSVQTIAGSALTGCYSLEYVIVGENVTSIASGFCQGVRNVEIHMRGTTPPTLSSSSNIPDKTRARYYVPYSPDDSVLNAYKSATNWSDTRFSGCIFSEPAPQS